MDLYKISQYGTKKVYIVIIGADSYRIVCKLKKAQVFAISIRELGDKAKKEARSETNPKKIVLEEYYDLLDIFLKMTQIYFFQIKKIIIKSY